MHIRYAALAIAVTLAGCESEVAAPDGPSFSGGTGTGVVIVSEGSVARQAENTAPTKSWVVFTRTAASTGTFEVGPGTAPIGVGSFALRTPTGGDKVFLFNYDRIGTSIADISALAYSTYQAASAVAVQLPSINLQVDVNGAAEGGFTTLVFEPVYNGADQGAVALGVWQSWDAYAGGTGIWWSTRDIPGVCAFTCYVPWSTIGASNPDAVIVGGIGVNQGSGNGGLDAAVDELVLGVSGEVTTYDFEPYVAATTRETCKNDGWREVTRADGSAFENQGDCVSYVESGK